MTPADSEVKMIYVISVLAGALWGCLFCWLNHKILISSINSVDAAKEPSKSAGRIIKAYIFRYLISFAALIAVYFICKLLPLHFLSMIIAAAVGLTLPSQIWHIRHDKPEREVVCQTEDEKENDAQSSEQDWGTWKHWENWDDWDNSDK